MIDTVLKIIAPHHCYSCDKTGCLLCQDCKNDIGNEVYGGCIVCGTASLSGVCSRCSTTYQKAWCVGEHEGVLKDLIHAYKFAGVKEASSTLAELLSMALADLPDNTVVVPVPTIAKHIRVRGYDHIRLIAKKVARRKNIKYKSLIERRHSLVQVGSDKNTRLKQAQSAFMCNNYVDTTVPYLLIDDVVTTNATIRYAAQSLKDAGVKTVWVAALARQPLEK